MKDIHDQFLLDNSAIKHLPKAGSICYSSPSNIALVKYWGKKPGLQIPANPSISFTLSKSKTNTELKFEKKSHPTKEMSLDFFFEGKLAPEFGKKTEKFLENTKDYFPFLNQYHLEVHTENTFPHSSGIASSASGMSALALTITELERTIRKEWRQEEFLQKASFTARIGSGSACRSVYGLMAHWGQEEVLASSSDLYAVQQNDVHAISKDFQDVILLVELYLIHI